MGEESLRDNLEAAFSEDESSVEENSVVDEKPVAEVEPVVDEVVEKDGVVDEKPAVEELTAVEKEEKLAGDEKTAKPDEEKRAAEETKDTGLKPPAGWKPTMREKFSKLPEDVQREVLRREYDIAKGMEIAADARRFKDEFDKHVAPYQAEIASRGVTAMDAFDNYLSTAYALRHAPPQEKASLVAGLINQYGIDIGILDQVLTAQLEKGGVPNNGAGMDPNIQRAVSAALQPYQQMLKSVQDNQIRTAEQVQTEIKSEITLFQDKPENEFFEDVKLEMASFLEAAAMRNQQMTLQEAYDRAILLRPDLAEIVSQRRLQKSAAEKDKAAKAAKAKAVGVSGVAPDLSGRSAQPQSLRGALEAAIDSVGTE